MSEISKPLATPSPFIFSRPTEFLKSVRDGLSSRKRPLSLKSWSQKLGYKTSRSLELVLSGDRLPSEDFIFRLSRHLKLSAYEKNYLSLMIQRERKLQKNQPVHDIEEEMNRLRPPQYDKQYIDNEVFRRISEWYPVVIRQLTMIPAFRKDIAWISKKLRGKVNAAQITAALAEWEGLALDRRALFTSEDVANLAGQTYHKKMLQKAIEAVSEVPVDHREYISITFKANKKDIPAMKKTLRECRDSLNASFNDDEGRDIFQLCLTLFPHTDLE